MRSLREESVYRNRGENVRHSALGLPKFKSSEKEERSARERRRRCPQAVFATTVESIPKALAGIRQQGIERNTVPSSPVRPRLGAVSKGRWEKGVGWGIPIYTRETFLLLI